MSNLDEVYNEFKFIIESNNPPPQFMRLLVKKFIFPLYVSFNERIRKCEEQYQVSKNPSSIRCRPRVVHTIPAGYMLVNDFTQRYYGCVGFISNTTKADSDLREFRKKIGRLIYVDGEAVHKFFDSPQGRKRYPRMISKVDLYNEQLSEN